MKKRVLLVCGVFYPEPVVSARMQTDLAKLLSERCQVTVLRPYPTRPKGFELPDYDYSDLPFEVVETQSYTCPASSFIGRMRESISHGRCCARYIRQHQTEIDVIYNDSWHLFGVYLVAKAAQACHIPYVTPVQDVYPEALTSKLPAVRPLQWLVRQSLAWLDHYTLAHAKCVQTNSEQLADYLSQSRQLARQHFVVVRNWQDEQPFIAYAQQKHPKEKGLFTFMYMGNVGPLAGIERLFEAFDKAHLENARLVIAGSGPAKDALQHVAQSYACRIDFWDVPSESVPETQAKADVMLLPVRKGSARFSVPSKLSAYLFSAKPVIASVDADSDTARCILDSSCGWLVEPEAVEGLTTAMQRAYGTPQEQLESMGQRGYDYAIQTFSKAKNLPLLYATIVS